MASTVRTVERVQITLGVGTTSAGVLLTQFTDIDDCVPFMTKRQTTNNGTAKEFAVNVYVDTGDNKVYAETNTSVTRALVVEVAVVEFNPAEARVYSYDFTDVSTNTITEVVSAKSFLVFSYTSTQGNSRNDRNALRGQIATDTSVVFDRIQATGTLAGRFYIVEAINTAFSVQSIEIIVDAGNLFREQPLDSPVNMSKSFVIASLKLTSGGNANEYPYIELTNENTLTALRQSISNTVTATAFVVTFSGDELVQRGIMTQGDPTASETADLTILGYHPVDLATAMAWIPAQAGYRSGAWTGASVEAIGDAQVALDFFPADGSALRVQHSIVADLDDVKISWEVIEWIIGAPPEPPRRVLVSSG